MDEDGHMPERLEEDLRFNGQITQPNHNSLSSRNCNDLVTTRNWADVGP
jgi:hypothetical protein